MSGSGEQQWYFAQGGQQQGPFPEATLRQMLATGQVTAADVVWRQGMPTWVPAGSVPGLMPAQVAPGMAPPPAPYPMPGYPPQQVMPLGYEGPQPAHGPPTGIGQDPGMRWLLPVGRSGWAIAAGYLGLFSFICIPAPLALIISIVAIMDIRSHPGRHGMGRAIFGLIMGLLGSLGLCFWLFGFLSSRH